MEHSDYREEIQLDGHPSTYDHTEPQRSSLFLFGGIIVVLVLLITAGVTIYYDKVFEGRVYSTVLAVDNDQLKSLRADEARELHSYAYLDAKGGKVRLPIDQAMEILARESAENRLKYPTNAYAVKTPEQMATQVPNVSQQGAAAATGAQNATSSTANVQPTSPVAK